MAATSGSKLKARRCDPNATAAISDAALAASLEFDQVNAPTKQLPKPLSYDDLYPGRFIKAADFRGKNTTLTIVDVLTEELEDEKGRHVKGILKFAKTEKQLALNRTNGECIKGMFGRDIGAWIGKRVTFYPAPYDGNLPLDITECIRVFGSPDIDADKVVTVRLPRKKPRNVTMRKVVLNQRPGAGSAPSAQASPSPNDKPKPADTPSQRIKYDEQTAMQTLREAGDLAGIDKIYDDVRASFPDGVPLEVEALWQGLRESFA